jgi:hypothetical protein
MGESSNTEAIDVNTKRRLTMKPMRAVSVLLFAGMFIAPSAFAVSQLLAYDMAVDDTATHAYVDNSQWEIAELSDSGSRDTTCTLTSTILEDNGDGSFDVGIAQSNGQFRVDGGSWQSMSSANSTLTAFDGRGRCSAVPNLEALFPNSNDDWYWGASSDSTGPFIATAVDVNDSWSQTLSVTPYGLAQRNVTVTCTLLAWESLNGHSCAKVRRTWTHPVSGYNTAKTVQRLTGDLSITEYVWFDYANKIDVKSESTVTGTLTMKTGEAYPDDEYAVDVTSSATVTLN